MYLYFSRFLLFTWDSFTQITKLFSLCTRFLWCFFVCVLLKWGLWSPHWCIFLYPASDKYLFIILQLDIFEWAIASGSEKTSGEVDCSFPDSAMLVLFCNVNRAYLLTLSLVNNSCHAPVALLLVRLVFISGPVLKLGSPEWSCEGQELVSQQKAFIFCVPFYPLLGCACCMCVWFTPLLKPSHLLKVVARINSLESICSLCFQWWISLSLTLSFPPSLPRGGPVLSFFLLFGGGWEGIFISFGGWFLGHLAHWWFRSGCFGQSSGHWLVALDNHLASDWLLWTTIWPLVALDNHLASVTDGFRQPCSLWLVDLDNPLASVTGWFRQPSGLCNDLCFSTVHTLSRAQLLRFSTVLGTFHPPAVCLV